ncbi:TIGR04283 family arsenosugar biosynthesis glycosyltransferase [Pleurocapsales cyanobacterium LEGE 10410]|nr:TIGR04283 family arsenosugar biosynthesis glycosyltransferase [Pleurocapsales cyanobacterium LEGE 10410]
MTLSEVSVIIPTLNEEDFLSRTLRNLSLSNPPPKEILVVDGGSRDNTLEIARQAGVLVLISQQAGRSIQMNLGAKKAQGKLLCFLHADTIVPDDFTAVIEKTLADPTIAGGGFISLMSGEKTRWGCSLHNYLKTYYGSLLFRPHLFLRGLRILFGDQAMFCRRSDFWDCGGFDPKLPIMEDADLCLKLCKYGRIYLVNRVVQSSDRRVAKLGWLKANAIYLYIGFLWAFGVRANYLKQFYEDIR